VLYPSILLSFFANSEGTERREEKGKQEKNDRQFYSAAADFHHMQSRLIYSTLAFFLHLSIQLFIQDSALASSLYQMLQSKV